MPRDLFEDAGISIEPRDLFIESGLVTTKTNLSPQEEKDFQKWYKEKSALTGIDPNPDDPRHFYDYRAAWKENASPEYIPEYRSYHWPDKYKLEGHPTYPKDVLGKMGEVVTGYADDIKEGWKATKAKPTEYIRGVGEIGMGAIEAPLSLFALRWTFPAAVFSGGAVGLYKWYTTGQFSGTPMRETLQEVLERTTYVPTTAAGRAPLEILGRGFEWLHNKADEAMVAMNITNKDVKDAYHFALDALLLFLPIIVRYTRTEMGKLKTKLASEKIVEGDIDGAAKDLADAMEAEPEATRKATVEVNRVTAEAAKRRGRKAKAEEAPKEEAKPLRTPAERQAKIWSEMPEPIEERIAWAQRRNQRLIEETFPTAKDEPGVFEEAAKLEDTMTALQRAAAGKGGEDLAIALEKADAILAEADATHKMARTAVERTYRDYEVLKEANQKMADLLEQLKREADPWIKEREKIAAEMEKMRAEELKEVGKRHAEFMKKEISIIEREKAGEAITADQIQQAVKEIAEKPRSQITPEDIDVLRWTPDALFRLGVEAERAKKINQEAFEAATGRKVREVKPKPPPVEKPSAEEKLGKAQLIAKAKEMGIATKGKSWEQLAAEVEGKPTPAQAVSITPEIAKVVRAALVREHGKAAARSIYEKLTDKAKMKIYEKERGTFRAKEEVEPVREKTLDDMLAEEEVGEEFDIWGTALGILKGEGGYVRLPRTGDVTSIIDILSDYFMPKVEWRIGNVKGYSAQSFIDFAMKDATSTVVALAAARDRVKARFGEDYTKKYLDNQVKMWYQAFVKEVTKYDPNEHMAASLKLLDIVSPEQITRVLKQEEIVQLKEWIKEQLGEDVKVPTKPLPERPLPSGEINIDRFVQRLDQREDFTTFWQKAVALGDKLRPPHVLEYIRDADGASPYYREMARVILGDPESVAILDEVRIRITKGTEGDRNEGIYARDSHFIELNLSKGAHMNELGQLILHESDHALTTRVLDNIPAFYNEVNVMLLEAKLGLKLTIEEFEALDKANRRYIEEWQNKDLKEILNEEIDLLKTPTLPTLELYYGLTNPYEFLAEAKSSPWFQRKLGEIESSIVIHLGKKRVSLKDKIWRVVNKYVFRDKLSPSILDKVFDVHERIVKEHAKRTPWGKARLNDVNIKHPLVLRSFSEATKKRWQEKGLTWLDDELYKQITQVGKQFFDQGANKYMDWSAKMLETFGEEFKPELSYIWGKVQADKTMGRDTRDALKQYGNPDEMVKAEVETVDGIKVPRVAISEAEVNHLGRLKGDLERPITTPGVISLPIYDFEYMDGKFGTNFKSLIYRPIEAVPKIVREVKDKCRRDLKEIRKKTGYKNKDVLTEGAWSIAKQLQASGDTAGLATLKRQIDIPDKLSYGQQAHYDYIVNAGKKIYDSINEARAASGKSPIGYVEDYTTFSRQMLHALDAGVDIVNASVATVAEFMKPDVLASFAKPRVKGSEIPFELNIENTFLRYIEAVHNYMYKGPVVARGREWQRMTLYDSEGRPYKLSDVAPRFDRMLTRYLNTAAGYSPVDVVIGDLVGMKTTKAIQKLTSNVASSILVGAIRIAIIQPSALASALPILKPRGLIRGVLGALNPREVAFHRNDSSILKVRYNETAISDAMADIAFRHTEVRGFKNRYRSIHASMKANGLLHSVFSFPDFAARMVGFEPYYLSVKEKGMIGITLLDAFSATAVRIGAYDKAKRMGMSSRSAKNYADDVVVKTQMSALSSDVSPIQTSVYGKAISLFQTWAIGHWNLINREILGFQNPMINRKTAFKRLMWFALGQAIVSSLYEDILGIGSPNPTPIRSAVRKYEETDDELLAIWEGLAEVAAYQPYISSARYGSALLGVVVDTAEDASNILMLGTEGKVAPDPAEITAKVLGLPVVTSAKRYLKRKEKGYSSWEALGGPISTETDSGALLEELVEE